MTASGLRLAAVPRAHRGRRRPGACRASATAGHDAGPLGTFQYCEHRVEVGRLRQEHRAHRAAVCPKARARRSGASATNCDASFTTPLSARGQCAQGRLQPAGRQRQVVQQCLALIGGDRAAQLVESLRRHMPGSQAAQRLDHEAARPPGSSHLARRGALEHDLHRPGLHRSAGAVGEELDPCGHLVGQSDGQGGPPSGLSGLQDTLSPCITDRWRSPADRRGIARAPPQQDQPLVSGQYESWRTVQEWKAHILEL